MELLNLSKVTNRCDMKLTKTRTCFLCDSVDVNEENIGDILVLRCNDCGFQHIPDNLKYLWEGYFSDYFQRDRSMLSSSNELRKKQYIIDEKFAAKYIINGTSVLDVGCSSGDFLATIYNSKKNLKIMGIDIDSSAIDAAKNKYASIGLFEEKNLLEVGCNKKFDTIIFRGTLQYLGDSLHDSMHYLKELLNDDGKIIIFSLPSTDAFMYYLLKDRWALFHPEMPLMFNESSIRRLSSKFRYHVERLEYPYLDDVYANPKEDYEYVKKIILGEYSKSVPFWGSLMTVVLSKDI